MSLLGLLRYWLMAVLFTALFVVLVVLGLVGWGWLVG